jgi:hypothetical protein
VFGFHLGTSTLQFMFSVFLTPVFSPAPQGSGYRKPGEKQVAMIAQKVMEANQTQHKRHPLIASTDLRTTTFRALLSYH